MVFATRAGATNYTWSGLGLDGKWSTKANWGPLFGAPAAYPGAGDNVTFNEIALGFTVTLDVNVNIASITLNSALSLIGAVVLNTNGKSLTITNGLNIGAISVILPTAFVITGSGTATINGAINAYPFSSLTFDTGSNITISSATVTGYNSSTITNKGTVTATASTFNLSNTSSGIVNSGTFNLDAASIINLTGTTSYVNNTGTFNLLSDATGSATIGPISSGATGFSGTYNVQRFLTGGATYNNGRWVYRNYRLMSSPVNAGLVSGNYPYTINYLAANAIVTGAKSTFGTIGGNPTIYVYSEDYTPSNTTFTSGNFKGVTDISKTTSPYTLSITSNGTSKALYVGNGYMFFFRGDNIHSVGTSPGKTTYPFVAPEPVVFTATGLLNQGTYTVNNWQTGSNLLYTTVTTPAPGNAAIQGYNLVGNPYASTIDWETVNSGGIVIANVNPSIYVLNPVTNQYNTYSCATHTGNDTATFKGKIASGQGFFVQANNSNPSIKFTESAKAPTSQLTGAKLMMGIAATQTPISLFRLKLIVDSLNYDDIAIGFQPGASSKYDGMEDTRYLTGMGAAESLSSFSADSVQLAVNVFALPKQKPDTIKLNVTAINSGLLTLKRTQLDALPILYEMWLMDNYKKDSLDIRNNTTYAFNLDKNDAASYGANRFALIIRQNKALGVHLLDFTAAKVTKGVQVAWKTENEANYTNFTVERSTDNGQTFNVLGGFLSNGQQVYNLTDNNPTNPEDTYRLKIEDLNGTVSYSKAITINYSNTPNTIASNINIYPNPAVNTINLTIKTNSRPLYLDGIQSLNKNPSLPNTTDSYSIKIINITGTIVRSAISATSTWQNNVGNLQPGTYIVQVVNTGNSSLVGKTTFIKL